MSRTAFRAAEPEHLELSDAPTTVGKQAALDWYHNVLGVAAVKLSRITERTNSRELPSYLVSGQVAYSTRDLFHDLASSRRAS